MDREPVCLVGGRLTTKSQRWTISAALVFALLWVPSVGRALQPIAGHAVAGMAKLNKSAVLPHDPTSAFIYIAPDSQPAPTTIDWSRPVVAPADSAAVDRAHEGIGLRAPPAPVL